MIERKKYNDLFLEKYLLGELSAEDAAEFRYAATLDNELAEKITRMRRFDTEFPKRFPPVFLSARTGSPRRWIPDRLTGWVAVCAMLAFAAIGVRLFIAGSPQVTPMEVNEDVRLKGLAPQLLIYRSNRGGVEMLRANDIVSAHDVLQIKYNSADFRYGVIFSVDSSDHTSLHFPASAHESTELARGESTTPFAFELDDTPGFERFVFVAANSPIDTEAILAAARHRTDFHGLGDIQVFVTLRKQNNE